MLRKIKGASSTNVIVVGQPGGAGGGGNNGGNNEAQLFAPSSFEAGGGNLSVTPASPGAGYGWVGGTSFTWKKGDK